MSTIVNKSPLQSRATTAVSAPHSLYRVRVLLFYSSIVRRCYGLPGRAMRAMRKRLNTAQTRLQLDNYSLNYFRQFLRTAGPPGSIVLQVCFFLVFFYKFHFGASK